MRNKNNVYCNSSLTKEFNIKEIFKQSCHLPHHRRHCVLVEGHPGYGKTTLARNIAVDWGMKADYVKEFKLVIFICCRDLKGRSFEDYVAETFPKLGKEEASVDLLQWHKHKKNLLFILDGLDECNPTDSITINKLLQGRTHFDKISQNQMLHYLMKYSKEYQVFLYFYKV